MTCVQVLTAIYQLSDLFMLHSSRSLKCIFFFFYKRGAAVVRISEIIHAVCAMSVNNNIFSSFRPQILLPIQPISQSYVDLPKIPLCLHHSTTPPPLLANLQLFPTANRSKSKFLNLHLSPSIKQPQNSFHPYFLQPLPPLPITHH